MDAMTQEYIIAQTRTVAQGLEALRDEHADLLNGLQPQEAQAARDRASLISKNIEMIELGLGEAEVMVTLASPVEMVKAEMQNLRYEVRMLRQENAWLREEIIDTQQKLHASERTVPMLYFLPRSRLFASAICTTDLCTQSICAILPKKTRKWGPKNKNSRFSYK